jgi:hypothetical protein
MTPGDRALLHRRWNPVPPSLCGRYVDIAACRLRFGKFDGFELADIPDHYLLWALATLPLVRQERSLLVHRLQRAGRFSVFNQAPIRAEVIAQWGAL